MDINEWSREYVNANRFLLDSASFYISARKLLVFSTMNGVKPGLVCGAYSIEFILKAALIYKGIAPPDRGSLGHNLYHLANMLDSKFSNKFRDVLNIFSYYFYARYFMNADNTCQFNGMNSGHFQLLDDIYKEIYSMLNIPTEYHHRVGLISEFMNNQNSDDIKILEFRNKYFEFYKELFNESSRASLQ